MSKLLGREGLKLWTPANYRIEVQGVLDKSCTECLADMCISSRRGVGQSQVTTLTGRIVDQAELLGVLNSIYELHLPILLVKFLGEDCSDPKYTR